MVIFSVRAASAKAFDQYGEMVGRYQKQLELKEKAEAMATNVNQNVNCFVRHVSFSLAGT